MDRQFLFQNSTLRILVGWLHMALHHVELLKNHTPGLGIDAKNLGGLALLLTGDHLDLVVLADMKRITSFVHHNPSNLTALQEQER